MRKDLITFTEYLTLRNFSIFLSFVFLLFSTSCSLKSAEPSELSTELSDSERAEPEDLNFHPRNQVVRKKAETFEDLAKDLKRTFAELKESGEPEIKENADLAKTIEYMAQVPEKEIVAVMKDKDLEDVAFATTGDAKALEDVAKTKKKGVSDDEIKRKKQAWLATLIPGSILLFASIGPAAYSYIKNTPEVRIRPNLSARIDLSTVVAAKASVRLSKPLFINKLSIVAIVATVIGLAAVTYSEKLRQDYREAEATKDSELVANTGSVAVKLAEVEVEQPLEKFAREMKNYETRLYILRAQHVH